MTLPERSPLTPEEQALAQRLARLGPHAEPSAALDARVLAAAHAAAQAPAARPVPRRGRWPAVVGLAASLVLAVGLAWRLRPQPEPPPAPRAEPIAALRAVDRRAPAADESAHAAAPTTPTRPQDPRREAAVAAQASAADAEPSPAKPPIARKSAIEPPAESPANAVLDEPAPAAPPPPPPAPELIRDNAARAAAAPAAPPPPAVSAAQDSDDDTSANANEADAADASSDMGAGDEPTDEVPPATAGSPEVRDAWLQRIHVLMDAGDIPAARASLREFTRRYPDYPLPEDLRALGR